MSAPQQLSSNDRRRDQRALTTVALVVLAVVATAGALIGPVLWSTSTTATPLYAIRSAAACDTCHIEPIGWYNPPDHDGRKCTLDCTGCHYVKTGGGMRTPSGDYYGLESLAMFGSHPGDGIDFEKYRDPSDNYSTKGRYRLWDGFSGWMAGKTPMADITDRFGKADPNPMWKIGADVRLMLYAPIGSTQKAAFFPMQAEVYGYVRPTKHFSLYAAAGAQGDRSDLIRKGEWNDRFTIRELYAQLDDFGNNFYVRAGRFTKPFGWRAPNHTLFNRAGLDYDQYSQVFGGEIGISPNYPYANLAVFYQGWDKWPGDQVDKGYGAALTAGFRDLGWQVGGSAEYLKVTQAGLDNIAPGKQITAGPLYGLNLFPFTLWGEADFRSFSPDDGSDSVFQMFVFHELDYQPTRGLNIFAVYEWQDVNLQRKDDQRIRYSLGTEWNPFKYTQATLMYRRLYQASTFLSHDVLFILHFWI